MGTRPSKKPPPGNAEEGSRAGSGNKELVVELERDTACRGLPRSPATVAKEGVPLVHSLDPAPVIIRIGTA